MDVRLLRSWCLAWDLELDEDQLRSWQQDHDVRPPGLARDIERKVWQVKLFLELVNKVMLDLGLRLHLSDALDNWFTSISQGLHHS